MTRAKEELHLTVPQRFFVHQQAAHGDRHVYASRSRFIPNGLTSLFEVGAWPVATNAAGVGEAPRRDVVPPVDLAARVRALWR
jgi:DNA helicase II / ATP-dependent DNA helicase PcrA